MQCCVHNWHTFKAPIQVLPDSSLPECSLLVEPMATSADSSSAIPSRSMTSSVDVSSSSDVTSTSESPTQSLAVPSISSAPSSSISVAPSVAGPSSSSVYRASSSFPPPALPTPTPSGPQGVRARILTYTCIYECIVLVVYSRSLCWCVLSNLRTLLYTWLCITSLNVLYSKCVTSACELHTYVWFCVLCSQH